MLTTLEKRQTWTEPGWSHQDEECPGLWGGTDFLWWGTLLPRIHAFVPTDSILEIAPGHGRITNYLKDLCDHLTVVDATPDCIEACKHRFSCSSNITYHLNDGKSLDMIPDQSIDFVISFDSLVHAEDEVTAAYLSQMTRILKPDGIGFIHHSSTGAIPPSLKRLSPIRKKLDTIWRAENSTARLFRQYCESNGLRCVSQEIINSTSKYPLPHNCFSVFTRKGSTWARPNKVFWNMHFSYESEYLTNLAHLYSVSSFE